MKSLAEQPVIAAYLMHPSYLADWTQKAARLIDALVHRYPAVRLWPNGGSCIYPWLARGLVHAYVMFAELRSEIDPGLAFAESAGFPVYAVEADDAGKPAANARLEPYRFDPAARMGRVPFFIAACTPELARDIVRVIRSGG